MDGFLMMIKLYIWTDCTIPTEYSSYTQQREMHKDMHGKNRAG